MAFAQQKVTAIHLLSTQAVKSHFESLTRSAPTAMSSSEWNSSSAVSCGGDGEWKALQGEEDTSLIILSSHGSFTCPESQLSITAGRIKTAGAPKVSALIKSASRQQENTHRAHSHSQLQLKCCTTVEKGTRGHLKVSEKPNYQHVIYCQGE